MMIADAIDGSEIRIPAVTATVGEVMGELTVKFLDADGACRYQARFAALIGWRHEDGGVVRQPMRGKAGV